MLIYDSIYGKFDVEEILEVLINTKAIQRLKNVYQDGASYLVNPKWNVTRYEHSIGVMILIRIMGGSIEEQIAGLLHDVSHTAFSHVVDFALDNKDEDYHEKIYKNIIENSEIPKILKNYGYDYKDILYNEFRWTILERPSPALCADRVDYTLRDMYHYGYITKDEIDSFISALCVVDGEIVVKSIKEAEWFVKTYYKEVIDFFLDPLKIYACDRLSKSIKVGLKNNIISIDDLSQTDNYVLDLLKKSKCEEAVLLIKEISSDVKVIIVDEKEYDIYQKNKTRLIDPTVLINGHKQKISEISLLSRQMNEAALKKSQKGIYLKVIH